MPAVRIRPIATPVLADITGLHITTATRWTRSTCRDWSQYLAARTQPPGEAEVTRAGARRTRGRQSGASDEVPALTAATEDGPAVLSSAEARS